MRPTSLDLACSERYIGSFLIFFFFIIIIFFNLRLSANRLDMTAILHLTNKVQLFLRNQQIVKSE